MFRGVGVRGRWRGAACAILLALLSGCGDGAEPNRIRERDAIPVILISCDTTRADRMSCYGYGRDTTPHLKAWAREAVVFENATTEETWTLPSHVTMLTGLHPNRHGVTANANLAESVVTLSERLAESDYRSAAFASSNPWFLPERGLSHGFDHYEIPTAPPYVRDVFTTHRAVTTWLDRHADPRLFLFVHNIDMHARSGTDASTLPYGPEDASYLHFSTALGERPAFRTAGPDPRFGWDFLDAANRGDVALTAYQEQYLSALYDDSVRSVDDAIRELFDDLKRRGLYENALIIVTADHGEELLERGTYGHGRVYQECARIPLLIRFPGGRFGGQRRTEAVQLADLYPTILDVLDLEARGAVDGASLLKVLEGRSSPRTHSYVQRYASRAVQSGNWKLLHHLDRDRYELYDLAQDPGETVNRAEDAPEVLARLQTTLHAFYAPDPAGWHIRIDGGGTAAGRSIAVSTSGWIERIRAMGSDRINDRRTIVSDDRRAAIDWSEIVRDEIIIKTLPADALLNVSIEAPAAFRVNVGGTVGEPVTRFDGTLDPERAGAASAAPSDSGPVISIWYEAPAMLQTPMRALTPEETRALEAVGYLE